jgi:hypothetical protein
MNKQQKKDFLELIKFFLNSLKLVESGEMYYILTKSKNIAYIIDQYSRKYNIKLNYKAYDMYYRDIIVAFISENEELFNIFGIKSTDDQGKFKYNNKPVYFD